MFGIGSASREKVSTQMRQRRASNHKSPYPIVITVDIDAQQTNISAETVFVKNLIDVLASNEPAFRSEIMSPVDPVLTDVVDMTL